MSAIDPESLKKQRNARTIAKDILAKADVKIYYAEHAEDDNQLGDDKTGISVTVQTSPLLDTEEIKGDATYASNKAIGQDVISNLDQLERLATAIKKAENIDTLTTDEMEALKHAKPLLQLIANMEEAMAQGYGSEAHVHKDTRKSCIALAGSNAAFSDENGAPEYLLLQSELPNGVSEEAFVNILLQERHERVANAAREIIPLVEELSQALAQEQNKGHER